MNILTSIYAILIGSFVGFLGGFQGIAGGFYISALLLMTGVAKTQRESAGTTLLSILFPLSLGAFYEYYSSGDVDVKSGLLIAIFYMIFAYIGAKTNKHFTDKFVYMSLAQLLFLTSLYFVYKSYHAKK